MAVADYGRGDSLDPRPAIAVIHENKIFMNGSSKDMAVNGSGTAQVFEYAPSGSEVRYVERLTFIGLDSGNASYSKFFSISALTNGLLIEIKSKGTTVTYANCQDNIDLTLAFPDPSSISSVSSGGGFLQDNDVFNGTIHFAAPIRLEGGSSDFLRATVRDNLSSLTTISIAADIWRVG